MSETSSAVGFIHRIHEQLYERLFRGEVDFERDMTTIKKHIALAEQMNEPVLAGEIHTLAGLMCLFTGYIEKAIDYHEKAFPLFASQDDFYQMGRIKNNLGDIYRTIGDYGQALTHFQEASDLLQKADDDTKLSTIASNIGLVWLAMDNTTRAEKHFQAVLDTTKSVTWMHVAAITESRRGLAEVHLAREEYAEAWQQANAAAELARGSSNFLSLSEVNLTRAHIAEADPNATEPASHYYQLSREGLSQHSARNVLARALITEARYQRRHNNLQDAERLAKEARTLFTEMGMEEEARYAMAMLS